MKVTVVSDGESESDEEDRVDIGNLSIVDSEEASAYRPGDLQRSFFDAYYLTLITR